MNLPNEVNLFLRLNLPGENSTPTFIHANGKSLTNDKKKGATLRQVNQLAEKAIQFLKNDINKTPDQERLEIDMVSAKKARVYLINYSEAIENKVKNSSNIFANFFRKREIANAKKVIQKLETLANQIDARQSMMDAEFDPFRQSEVGSKPASLSDRNLDHLVGLFKARDDSEDPDIEKLFEVKIREFLAEKGSLQGEELYKKLIDKCAKAIASTSDENYPKSLYRHCCFVRFNLNAIFDRKDTIGLLDLKRQATEKGWAFDLNT